MKFIKDMMSRKPKDTSASAEPAGVPAFESVIGQNDKPNVDRTAKIQVVDEVTPAAAADPAPNEVQSDAIMEKLTNRLSEEGAKPAVNIWDMEGDSAESAAPAAAPSPSGRRRRNKTRLLGFDAGDGDVVSMFDAAQPTKPAERTKFPVGWILVAEGPGRGECFTLEAGMSQIGRGEDQAIQLDFGDNSISRSNHAAIVYDTETHKFTLGHGGKKNIVRLNGNPVISNETINTGDKIKIGETMLHFVPLCSDEFNWSDDGETKENEDVAIA